MQEREPLAPVTAIEPEEIALAAPIDLAALGALGPGVGQAAGTQFLEGAQSLTLRNDGTAFIRTGDYVPNDRGEWVQVAREDGLSLPNIPN